MATRCSYLYYCHDDLVINNVHSTEVPPPHGEKTHMQLLWLKEGFSETRLGPATIPCRAAVGPRAIVLCTSALEQASSPMVHYVFLAGWRHLLIELESMSVSWQFANTPNQEEGLMGSHQAGCSAHTQPSQRRFFYLLLRSHALFISRYICV